MHAYCTYFDSGYLTRGLALLESITKHDPGSTLHVLCLDEAVETILGRLAPTGLVTHGLSELENLDPELRASRDSRSIVEYYFTCGPAFLKHLLASDPSLESLTYIDADMYLFSSPDPLFRELGHGSIGLVEHRFPRFLRDRERYGRFNVGYMIFRRDESAISCIDWWHERCIEWCFDRLEGDRFADQKYLEKWPELFERVVILSHPGINVAPWNVARHRVGLMGDTITIDLEALIAFHFHGFRQLLPWLFDTRFGNFRTPLTGPIRNVAYPAYIDALRRASTTIETVGGRPIPKIRRRDVSLSDRMTLEGLRALVDGIRFRNYLVSRGGPAL